METSTKVESVTVQSEGTAAWQKFTSRHPDATPFHTIAWKHAVESTFAYDSSFYYIYVDGELAGVIPLFRTPAVIGSDITQPFCEYGSPLVNEGYDQAKVLNVIADKVNPLDTLIIKDSTWTHSRGYSAEGYGGIETGCTFRLLLDEPFDQIRESRFTNEVRRSLRKANEAGLEVREGDVEEYYPVYVQTMRRIGSPQFPLRFFESLQSSFGDNLTVLLSELRGSVVAGVLIIDYGDESVVWSNASFADAWPHKPNYLLYARAIRRAISSGRSVLDFGRTSKNSGVYDFKHQFGGHQYDLMSMVYPPHRLKHASLSQYRFMQPLMATFGSIITNKAIGPRLKEWIHE